MKLQEVSKRLPTLRTINYSRWIHEVYCNSLIHNHICYKGQFSTNFSPIIRINSVCVQEKLVVDMDGINRKWRHSDAWILTSTLSRKNEETQKFVMPTFFFYTRKGKFLTVCAKSLWPHNKIFRLFSVRVLRCRLGKILTGWGNY